MSSLLTQEDLTFYRRYLHQIPELGFDVFKTREFLISQLHSMGYITQTVGKTGVLVHKSGLDSRCLLFRSDMDALPIEEATTCDFQSQHQGIMHACGHDGHMAILLGFAKQIAHLQTKYSILLLFQPAEEGPGGAKLIIEEGLFHRYEILHAFGLHLYPELEGGMIGYHAGGFFAQSGEVDIEILGISSHGAKPHLGADALVASSHLVSSLQSIVSRSIDPFEQAVVTIGKISGGYARNIIASTIRLEGTIRAFDEGVYDTIKKRIREIATGIEWSDQVVVRVEIRDFYPVVKNDVALTKEIVSSLSHVQAKEITPVMFAEDFAYFSKQVPSLFVMLGSRNDDLGYIHPLHSNQFQFEETILLSGVRYFEEVLRICSSI